MFFIYFSTGREREIENKKNIYVFSILFTEREKKHVGSLIYRYIGVLVSVFSLSLSLSCQKVEKKHIWFFSLCKKVKNIYVFFSPFLQRERQKKLFFLLFMQREKKHVGSLIFRYIGVLVSVFSISFRSLSLSYLKR